MQFAARDMQTAQEWYLFTQGAEASVRVQSGLTVGLDEEGQLSLTPCQRVIVLDITARGALALTCASPDDEIRSTEGASTSSVVLDPGTPAFLQLRGVRLLLNTELEYSRDVRSVELQVMPRRMAEPLRAPAKAALDVTLESEPSATDQPASETSDAAESMLEDEAPVQIDLISVLEAGPSDMRASAEAAKSGALVSPRRSFLYTAVTICLLMAAAYGYSLFSGAIHEVIVKSPDADASTKTQQVRTAPSRLPPVTPDPITTERTEDPNPSTLNPANTISRTETLASHNAPALRPAAARSPQHATPQGSFASNTPPEEPDHALSTTRSKARSVKPIAVQVLGQSPLPKSEMRVPSIPATLQAGPPAGQSLTTPEAKPNSTLAHEERTRTSPVRMALADLTALRKTPPQYPRVVRKITVSVDLAFTVNLTGQVENLRVIGTPPSRFAKAAIKAVGEWRFKPVRVGETTQAVESSVRITFRP